MKNPRKPGKQKKPLPPLDDVCGCAGRGRMTPAWDEKSLLEAFQTVKPYTPAVPGEEGERTPER